MLNIQLFPSKSNIEHLFQKFGEKTIQKYRRAVTEEVFKELINGWKTCKGIVYLLIYCKDGSLVFVRKKWGWFIPKGGIEIQEDIEDAAIREAKEETGLEIRLTRLKAIYHQIFYSSLGTLKRMAFVFIGQKVSGRFDDRLDKNEILEVKSFRKIPYDRIPKWCSIFLRKIGL